KFSDSLDEQDHDQTLAGLATLAAPPPPIPRSETPRKETLTPAKVAKVAKVGFLEPYSRVFAVLCERCLDRVEQGRWRQAVEDGRRFLHRWGRPAEELGWTADDLFALDAVTPLARYDVMGLVWCLQGAPVVALTAHAAAIRMPAATILKF